MQRPAVQRVQLIRAFSEHLVEKAARPIRVAAIWPSTDEFEINAEARHVGDEAAELLRILFRREPAAAAPRLIADAPISHLEGIAVTRRGAHIRERRHARWRVAVL